jgi:hypothetical protein
MYFCFFSVILSFALSGIAAAGSLNIGDHYNLNIIGSHNVQKLDTDPDCFKGNAGDMRPTVIQFSFR